ncbi:hypothetical protein Tco_0566351 [Tanacetum coccineum]
MLMNEKDKISNDSKDIQANLLKRIKILEDDFQRSQAQSIDFELQLQHQKKQTTCDISWKSKMEKLNGDNVSLNIQIESLLQERENIKLEYQKLFNSIKMTRAQHQREVNELIENINQKTYAYGDVRSKNQVLLMTISEHKAKLKTAEKGKNVNTKFDKSATLEKLICVTSMNKNKDLKAKMVSKVEDVKKSQRSVSLVSTKRNTLNLNVYESKEIVLKAKTVNAVNDGSYLVIQIVIWIVDIGCSKHMTGNLKLLRNFVEKFMRTFRFGNDQFAAITRYRDYVQGNLTICHVYYVEGLGHNLFFVKQFCDRDLEVAFSSNTCYVRNLEGEDLLSQL